MRILVNWRLGWDWRYNKYHSLLAICQLLQPALAKPEFSLLVGLPLHVLIELLHLRLLPVGAVVVQPLDQFDHVLLECRWHAVEFADQFVLVSCHGLLHEGRPVRTGDDLEVELAKRGLVEGLGQDEGVFVGLHANEGAVALDLLAHLAVLLAGEEDSEARTGKEVFTVGQLPGEAGEVVVGTLAEDEQRDRVVGMHLLVGSQDARHHLLEDEHEAVSTRYVQRLPLLHCLLRPPQLLPLGPQRLQYRLLHRFLLSLRPLLLPRLLLHLLLQLLLRFLFLHVVWEGVAVVEDLVVLDAEGRSESVDDFLLLEKKGVAVDLLPADAGLRVYGEAALDEVPRPFRNVDFRVVRQRVLDSQQDIVVSNPLERVVPVDELVEHHPHRPDISLPSVRTLLVHLRRHRQPRPQDGRRHRLLLHLLRKTQVCDLAHAVLQQDVGSLEIAVHGLDLVKALEAIEDLLEEGCGLVFSESAFIVEVVLKFSALAVLHDDDDATLSHEVVDVADDVLVLALTQYSDFSLDQLHKFRRLLEDLLGHHLGRSRLALRLAEHLVHPSVVALPDQPQEGVVLDLHPHQALLCHFKHIILQILQEREGGRNCMEPTDTEWRAEEGTEGGGRGSMQSSIAGADGIQVVID